MNTPRRTIHSRGFALPLVALLALLAGISVTLLFDHQSYGRLAAKRHELQYQTHHVQAGMKEMVEFWLQYFKRPTQPVTADTIMGFDLVTKDSQRMEIRLSDVQGSVLRSAPGGDVSFMDLAADLLVTWGEESIGTVRSRGPAKISLHTAPESVLQAMAMAIDPKCDATGFSSAVISKRSQMRLADADIPDLLTAAQMSDEDRSLLKGCVTIDPSLWMVVVTVRNRSGTVIERQGGMAVGSAKQGLGTAGGWTFLSWGPLSSDDPRVNETLPASER